MNQLTRLTLRGWKTIRDLSDLELRPLNVFIGANGAGKSNLISFFRMLNWVTSENLQGYVATFGGANALLHDGAARTPQLSAALEIETEKGSNDYEFRLFHAAQDILLFAEERFRLSWRDSPAKAGWRSLGAGHREARLLDVATEGDATARVIRHLLRQCVVHQFHNTSGTARVRQRWDVTDGRFLKEDGANLAPMLLRLREENPLAYRRIVETVRQILPFFADFFLEPTSGSVYLQWTERGTDVVFGAHQASDGMLRALALITLLLQPIEDIPSVLILDEPELGLHPFAITVIAGLLRSVSLRKQVLLATQSITMLNQFAPEDVIVVDRRGRESHFTRLDAGSLQEWLEDYSLGELWEKNVISGRPQR